MSLDITLTSETKVARKFSGIYIRRNGQTEEISYSEFKDLYPDKEPVRVVIEEEILTNQVYECNITHNLSVMAKKSDLYFALWKPYTLHKDYNPDDYVEDKLKVRAERLIPHIVIGLRNLKEKPELYKPYSAVNGWGTYEQFVLFVGKYLEACKKYPNAIVNVSR